MRLNGFSVRSKTTPLPVRSPVVFSCLKSFQKTLTALEELIERNTAVAAQKREQALALDEQVDDLSDEARKAQEIAKNIKALLGE